MRSITSTIKLFATLTIVLLTGTVVSAQCLDNFFSVKPSITMGSTPRSVIFADFNRDGIQDLAAPSLPSSVNVRLGDGVGGYLPVQSTSVGTFPAVVVTADFNRDGKPDIAVTNQSDGTISVALGNGDGTFATPQILITGGNPEGLVAADFNRDGKVDLASAFLDEGNGGVKVFYANDGGFEPAISVSVGPAPRFVFAEDMDLSGTPDLVVIYDFPTTGEGIISIRYKSEGGTGFPGSVDVEVGDYPLWGAITDLNGDKFPDVVTANSAGGSVSTVLSQDAQNGLYSSTEIPTDGNPQGVAISDVNQDGKEDIVVVNGNPAVGQFLLGNGSGSFTAGTGMTLGGGLLSIGVTDYNLDAKPDIVATKAGGSNNISILENACPLFSGAVSGLATGPSTAGTGGITDCGLKGGTCTVSTDRVTIDAGSPNQKTILTEDPIDVVVAQGGLLSGSVTSSKFAIVTTGKAPSTLGGLFNLSGDGKLRVKLYKADALGEFQEVASTVIDEAITSPVTGALAKGDMDADGIDEFMVVDADEKMVRTFKVPAPDIAAPTFLPVRTIEVGEAPIGIASGDFNKDGKSDLITANKLTRDLSLYLTPSNPGLLELATNVTIEGTGSGTTEPTAIDVADLNNDGNLDVVVGTDDNIQVLTGTDSGTYTAPQVISTDAAEVKSIDTGDMNKDGKLDIVAVTKDPITGDTQIETKLVVNPVIAQTLIDTVKGAQVPVAPDSTLLIQSVNGDAQPDIIVKTDSAIALDSYLGTVYAAPLAASDSYTVDRRATINTAAPGVIGNDAYPDGANVVAELVSGPANSTWFTLNPDGSFNYTASNYNAGSDSFTYKLKDGAFESAPVTVSITINFVNTPPVALGESFTCPENIRCTRLAPELLLNEFDADGDPLTVIPVAAPAHAIEYAMAPDGHFMYAPQDNNFLTDTMTYKVTDGYSESNIVTIHVTVTLVNDAPSIGYKSAELVSIPALQNTTSFTLHKDDEETPNDLTFSLINAPAGMSLDPVTGIYTWTPTAAQGGGTAHQFQICVSDEELTKCMPQTLIVNPAGSPTGIRIRPRHIGFYGPSVRDSPNIGNFCAVREELITARGFAVFQYDLERPRGVVGRGRFEVRNLEYTPGSPLFTLYDVETPIPTLLTSSTPNTEILEDLGSGQVLGSQILIPTENVELNAIAIAALQGQTKSMAIGGDAFGGEGFCTVEMYLYLEFNSNNAPAIGGANISRQQAAGASSSTIATVSDAEDAEDDLSVTVNGGASATSNGVSVSNIAVSPMGAVTADVGASCGATNASFSIQVADSAGQTSTSSFNVTVTNETTAPVINGGNPPPNVTVYLPLNSPALSRTVVYSTPTATDNCTASPTVVSTPASGSAFPVGTTTVNGRAIDAMNNTSTVTFTVTVLFNFGGFLQPIDPMPIVNIATAGSGVPVKFSLSGNKGVGIVAAGYPASAAVACGTNEPGDAVEETASAGASVLTYDAATDKYIYVWKTNKSWKGECRIFVLRLTDGSEYFAKFRFK